MNQLLITIADSLLNKNDSLNFSLLLYLKYIIKEIRIKIERKIKTNTPLSGSFAKVCTEFKIPDLTKNVPLILRINVVSASIIVHDCKFDLFSNTKAQCNNAVKQNHGINETFSTGSQNQKPPQPNS